MTVGDFVAELEGKAEIEPRTLRGYSGAFRKIVADAFKIDGGKEKFDYRKGGRQRWIERIDRVKLAAVTPDVIRKWKREFLARAEDPIRRRSASVSFNSIMRCAKSLFSPDLVKRLSKVPLSPFAGVKFEPKQSMRYRSTINAKELMRDAQAELAHDDPPSFLVFLLALTCGLRKLEIDRLEWSAFQWDEGVVRIEPTEYFDVKTEHSIGDVALDTEIIEIMRGHYAKARSNFVIESSSLLNKKHATRQHYRAQKVFKRLNAWLRKHGVTSQKPLHELRKECGSLVNRKHGLTAAKDVLRHGDIATTAGHYIDRQHRATSGLGSLLKATQDGKIVRIEQEPLAHQA